MKVLIIIFQVALLLLTGLSLDAEEAFYGTGQWDAARYGNHRAVVKVTSREDAVAVHIPWRRRDADPQAKGLIVMDAMTGIEVHNVVPVEINREYCDLIFRPHSVPGAYYVYYMPYISTGSKHYPKVTYRKPKKTASKWWLKKHGLNNPSTLKKTWAKLKRAEVGQMQSIDAFNSFYPMEVIATEKEIQSLLAMHPEKNYLLFPEDREHPIRMTDDLPQRWIQSGARTVFEGAAAPGEYYAFQVGLFAVKAAAPDVEIYVTVFKNTKNAMGIPPVALRCFNLSGTDWTGKPFLKKVTVEKGKIQPLWFGLEVPEQLMPGDYEGTITFTPKGLEVQALKVRLTVKGEPLKDYGDSDPRRLSRLRWLNSVIAHDYHVVKPFTNMRIREENNRLTVACLGRNLTVDRSGFPVSIRSRFAPEVTHILEGEGREILAAPIKLVLEGADKKPLDWGAQKLQITRRAPGAVGWAVRKTAGMGAVTLDCSALMEMDGFVQYNIVLRSTKELPLSDVRLEIPMKKDAARYMMGLGVKGGFRPAGLKWKWEKKKNQDSAWIGDVNAGLQCSLRGANYIRPLNTNFYQLKPLNMPVSWYNDGKGGIDFSERDDMLLVKAYSGERTLKPGEELHFNFSLLITPFKTLDTAGQWGHRFYHRFNPLKEIAATGANTVNVHHATEINPFINYPFLRPKEMKAYIDEAHGMGMKVKIYYTVRELSNYAPELFALLSLGDEVLSYGPGGGFAWLQEHLTGNYIAGWLVPKYKDAAVINSGVSRWHNYYLEGLDWLVKNVGIDGLYIDDVAFDRTVMKRVRKILDRGNPGSMIDLHSANQFNPRDGFANSANLYLEHFPYINRLWFGEYFDYNSKPDFWMVEVSGIPFGLMGEMLQDGGNPWRGMVYGMTSRLPWAGDPKPLWKAWDDFGIKESRMVGYWSSNRPVKTDNKDVLATAYVIDGKRTMVALGSWADADVACGLAVDWKALGLNPKKVQLRAPAIEKFQAAAEFKPGDRIPIPKGKGLLLIIE